MHMPGYQPIGMDGAVPMLLSKEAWLPIDPALHDVQREGGELGAGVAWQAS